MTPAADGCNSKWRADNPGRAVGRLALRQSSKPALECRKCDPRPGALVDRPRPCAMLPAATSGSTCAAGSGRAVRSLTLVGCRDLASRIARSAAVRLAAMRAQIAGATQRAARPARSVPAKRGCGRGCAIRRSASAADQPSAPGVSGRCDRIGRAPGGAGQPAAGSICRRTGRVRAARGGTGELTGDRSRPGWCRRPGRRSRHSCWPTRCPRRSRSCEVGAGQRGRSCAVDGAGDGAGKPDIAVRRAVAAIDRAARRAIRRAVSRQR